MSSKRVVLVVEDEGYIANVLSTLLSAHGYKVITANSAVDASALISSHVPDLVLLDLGLPDRDGIEVLKELREWSAMPVIVVSARSMEKEKVTALDHGADDYITKPFGAPELLARVRAALRRSVKGDHIQNSYAVGELFIDFNRRRVTVDGTPVHLTQVEYRIMEFIARQPGCVLTHSSIISHVWGPHAPRDNTRILRVNMANIRRKIEKDRVMPRYILTEIGVGYRMADE